MAEAHGPHMQRLCVDNIGKALVDLQAASRTLEEGDIKSAVTGRVHALKIAKLCKEFRGLALKDARNLQNSKPKRERKAPKQPAALVVERPVIEVPVPAAVPVADASVLVVDQPGLAAPPTAVPIAVSEASTEDKAPPREDKPIPAAALDAIMNALKAADYQEIDVPAEMKAAPAAGPPVVTDLAAVKPRVRAARK